MLGTLDFFVEQICQCRSSASQCTNKNDREFWLKMAARWEGLLQARQNADGGIVRPSRLGRSMLARRLAKRQRAA
jgi:hypothetical protein